MYAAFNNGQEAISFDRNVDLSLLLRVVRVLNPIVPGNFPFWILDQRMNFLDLSFKFSGNVRHMRGRASQNLA
jgi:hypothetical protein